MEAPAKRFPETVILHQSTGKPVIGIVSAIGQSRKAAVLKQAQIQVYQRIPQTVLRPVEAHVRRVEVEVSAVVLQDQPRNHTVGVEMSRDMGIGLRIGEVMTHGILEDLLRWAVIRPFFVPVGHGLGADAVVSGKMLLRVCLPQVVQSPVTAVDVQGRITVILCGEFRETLDCTVVHQGVSHIA